MNDLDENETFRFTLTRLGEEPIERRPGVSTFRSKAKASFKCECEECMISTLAIMQNFVNSFRDSMGISPDRLKEAQQDLIDPDNQPWKSDRPKSNLN